MRKKSSSPANKAPGQRQLRVGERIRHILAEILMDGNFHDPALAQSRLITITAVDIGPDLQHANAYIMPLGGRNAEEILKALNRAAGFFRSEMAGKLELRYTPKISFRIDNSFEESDRISRLLNQENVRKDLDREMDAAEDGDDD